MKTFIIINILILSCNVILAQTYQDKDKTIGNIYLGMLDVKAKLAIRDFESECEKDGSHFIGTYEFSEIQDEYYNDTLFMIIIRGVEFKHDYFSDNIPTQVKVITDLISKKYGTASESFPVLKWYNYENNSSHLMKKWNKGNKLIQVVLSNYDYFRVDVIFNNESVRIKIQKEQKEKDAKENKDAEGKF